MKACSQQDVTTGSGDDALSGMTDKDTSWLAHFEGQFGQVAGDDRQIYMEEFTKVLNVKKSFFAERFFHLIDTDGSGSISLKELLTALKLLIHGSATDKLHFLFRVYDVDGNGSIDFSELRTVLKSCTAESALQLSEETLDELTDVLFEEADTDSSGTISFEELQAQLEKYPDIADNLTISAADWLRPPSHSKKPARWERCCSSCLSRLSFTSLRNNRSTIVFLAVYAVLHLGLTVWGVLGSWQIYPDRPWLMVARGAGRCLSFDCVFVLCLMLRKCLTLIRSTNAALALGLIDQHVDLHRLVGFVIVGLSVVHVQGHMLNYSMHRRQGQTVRTTWS